MARYRPRFGRTAWIALGVALVGLAAALLFVLVRARGDTSAGGPARPAGGSATVTITVPPPLPGEPPLGADYDRMLQRFAANLSQGIYTRANLEFLVCNSEKGLAVARAAGGASDPRVAALMRRMTALFRSAPGMAHATCP